MGTSAVWIGEHAYVFGGCCSTNQIVRYDPATDTTTLMSATLPTARYRTSAVWTGEHAYVFGGSVGSSRLNQIVRYSLEPGAAPQNLAASRGPGVGEITLEWQPPPENTYGSPLTSYRIYRSVVSGGPYAQVAEVPGNTLTYTDTGLPNGVTRHYRVSAVNDVDEGPQSNEASATTFTASAPRNLRGDPGNERVTLTWEAPASQSEIPITHYEIVRTSPGGTTVFEAATTAYVDMGLTNGVTYAYKVRGVNTIGPGAFSEEIQVRPPGVPSAPLEVRATSSGNREITLTWLPPIENADSVVEYRVYRSTDLENYSFAGEAEPTLRVFVDPGLAKGVTYFYRVTAWNGFEESNPSNTAFATVPVTPDAVTGLAGVPGNNRVTLTWTAPPGNGGPPPTHYNVYRSEGASPSVLVGRTAGAETTFLDATPLNGHTYAYHVRGVNGNGEGDESAPVTATPSDLPTEPRNLAASTGNARVTLSWSAPLHDGGTAISGYKVYRDWTPVANVTSTGFTDESVVNGVAYQYEVSAVNGGGEGPRSDPVTAIPDVEAPSAPLNLQATEGNATVTLAWEAPSTDGGSPLTGYRVYRGTSCDNKVLVDNVSAGTPAFADAGLVNGVTYCYHVTAVNNVGEGAKSADRTAKPQTEPGLPVNVQVTPGNGENTVSWEPAPHNGAPVTEYRIYRGSTPGTEALHDTVGGNELEYPDAGLTNGVTYHYRVSAVNVHGEGPPSPSLPGTPRTIPDAPENLEAEPHDERIVLSWTAPASDGGAPVTGYKIHRYTPGGAGPVTVELENDWEQGPEQTYEDTGLTNGVTYCYTVTALNAAGESPASNEDCAIANAVPSPPRNLQATPGDEVVHLCWDPPEHEGDGSVTGYRVYRGLAPGGTAELVVPLPASNTCFDDTGRVNGVTYYYTVTAVNGHGESPKSNEASATPGT